MIPLGTEGESEKEESGGKKDGENKEKRFVSIILFNKLSSLSNFIGLTHQEWKG